MQQIKMTEKICFIDILISSLPQSFLDEMEGTHTYADETNEGEHIYSISGIYNYIDGEMEEVVSLATTAILEEIEKLMSDNDAAYFRLVNY